MRFEERRSLKAALIFEVGRVVWARPPELAASDRIRLKIAMVAVWIVRGPGYKNTLWKGRGAFINVVMRVGIEGEAGLVVNTRFGQVMRLSPEPLSRRLGRPLRFDRGSALGGYADLFTWAS